MKKYIYSTLIVVMTIGLVKAQPAKQDSVEVEIEGNKITLEAKDFESLSEMDLNRLIKDVVEKTTKIQKQQNDLLARVEKQEEAGEITAEQAEEMKETITERTEDSMEVIEELMETWGESYAERWEDWADAYEAKMEVWEGQIESQENDLLATIPPLPDLPPLPPAPGVGDMPKASAPSDSTKKKGQKIIISDEGIIIQEGDGSERPFALDFNKRDDDDDDNSSSGEHRQQDRTETYTDFNFGFNQLLEGGQYQVFDEPAEQNFWKSTQFEFGMGGKTRIGSPYSKLYLKWGGEFSWHNFRLKGNNILVKQENPAKAAVFTNDSLNNYAKSKFEIVYFNVPLMLQLDFSDVGDIDEAFTLGVGGYLGVRLKARRRLEFNDFEGSETKSEDVNDFYTNPFRYGAMAQIGWKSFKVTAKYDLSTYFEQNRDLNQNYQMASISVGFTL